MRFLLQLLRLSSRLLLLSAMILSLSPVITSAQSALPSSSTNVKIYKQELDRISGLMKKVMTHADDSHPRYQKLRDFLLTKVDQKSLTKEENKDVEMIVEQAKNININELSIKSLPDSRIYSKEIARLEKLKEENKKNDPQVAECYLQIQKYIIALVMNENKVRSIKR
ncbi:MAG: hypothetical protein HQK49_15865 [Oligoflexia bacterium]|nr:hypothetical protein [Oligoflexia bacterium]